MSKVQFIRVSSTAGDVTAAVAVYMPVVSEAGVCVEDNPAKKPDVLVSPHPEMSSIEARDSTVITGCNRNFMLLLS